MLEWEQVPLRKTTGTTTTASHRGKEKPAWSHLNEKVPKLQITQDLMHNLQALSIGNHRVKLASDVKILGAQEKAVSNSGPLA